MVIVNDSVLQGSCTLLGMLFSQNRRSSIKKTQIKAKLFEKKKPGDFLLLAKRVESKHYHDLTNQNEFSRNHQPKSQQCFIEPNQILPLFNHSNIQSE